LILKAEEVRRRMVADKGEFALFAMFLRENAQDVWDLVASAPWTDPADVESYQTFYRYLGKVLSVEEFKGIARVVILNISDPYVRDFCEQHENRERFVPIRNFSFGKLQVLIGYVLAASAAISLDGKRARKTRPKVKG
jgi:hypothetical protein